MVEQLEKTIELLRLKYLENRFYFEGIYRKEDLIYPEDALREAVINALIHRDYLGPHTQLRVYNDKLWLWNAGRLSREMTFAGLKKPHSSYPRNELLADIFFKAGFIEAWGSGTLKIVNKCRQASLPEPEFSEMTGGFLTSFFKHRVTEKVTEKQEIILDEIRRNPYITIKVLSETAGISERKIKENIKKLKQKKLIERVGPARGGRWEAGG